MTHSEIYSTYYNLYKKRDNYVMIQDLYKHSTDLDETHTMTIPKLRSMFGKNIAKNTFVTVLILII